MQIQILWEKIGKANFSVSLRILSLFFPKTDFHIRLWVQKVCFFSHSYRLIKLLKGNFNGLETLFF